VEQSPNLTLPYILPSQAQKHVTHNEALRMLDALVQLSVVDDELASPPGEVEDSERYIVGDGAVGAWEGHDGEAAAWQDGAWAFFVPRTGWLAWSGVAQRLLVHDGTSWQPVATEAGGAAIFGINATADETNRLTVAAPATLLNHEGAGHQLKLNKAAVTDTASLLFQTGFSGRAEMGTAGDDDFGIKVSADGAQWLEALVIDRASGVVRLPLTPGRDKLSAARTYYVRTDGDDDNDGLADSAAGAFATIQKAIDTVANLDLGIQDVTIQIGAGTYTDPVILKALTGAGAVTLRGNPSTPSDVVISRSGAGVRCIEAEYIAGDWRLDGLRLTTSGTSALSACIHANGPATTVRFENIDFGPSQGRHISAEGGALMKRTGPCTISGGAAAHLFIRICALYDNLFSGDVTFVGDGLTANFTAAFAVCATNAVIFHPHGSYVNGGSVTGQRYQATRNGVIQSGDGTAGYFPGDAAGTTETGGQYV
jgi:hypothetical protein